MPEDAWFNAVKAACQPAAHTVASRAPAAYLPAVELKHVTVRYPDRETPALLDVSLRVEPGEQVLVLGASGSGKSTLLQVITGVAPHSMPAEVTGSVRICGQPVENTSVVARSRMVGFVGQDPAAGVCLPRVDQEVALTCENHAVPATSVSDRIDEALQVVGGTGLRHRATGTLSGGECQRVALAATVVVPRAVLLLDEPTSMLDASGVRAVREAVAAVSASTRPAVLLVEHRLDEYAGPGGVADLPERTVVLQKGRVIADGPTTEVLRHNARHLHQIGCWLPLEAELHAVFRNAPASLVEAVVHEMPAARPTPTGPPGQVDAQRPVLLAARAVTAGHQRAPVISDVNLDVDAGAVVALLGPNGSGKSTLLLTLGGLLPAITGEVTGARPGMVFQNPEHGFIGRTVTDEIRYGLPNDVAAVASQLSTHRLEHCRDQSPFHLSGGEKRRLSLAAMLVHPRPVLLADEPTYGLDRRGGAAVAAALSGAAAVGRAVVLSSHDLRLVATIATTVMVLGGGRVIAGGPTLDVLRDRSLCAVAGLVLPSVLWRLFSDTDNNDEARVALEFLSASIPAALADRS